MSPQPWQAHTAGIDINEAKGMQAPVMPELPTVAAGPYCAQYQFFKDDGRPFVDYAWRTQNGTQLLEAGKTNAKGQGAIANTEQATAVQAFKTRRRESERISGDWQSQLDQKAGG